MRLLLDTHAALWWLLDDRRIGPAARRRLIDGANEVLLSAVSVWEVAIKRALGKITAPETWADTALGLGARPLPISLEHAAAVADLPSHHRDPFDRLLIAQATLEGAVIVTHDEAMRAYAVPIVW